MPSQYIHVACAQGALRELGDKLGDVDVLSFNLGCQGPDIFSHNRHTRPLALAYARLLHRRLYGDFCGRLAVPIAASGDTKLRSWFFGFLTHAAVDRALHPYIISRSSPGDRELPRDLDRSRLHAFFERILDAAMQERLSAPESVAKKIDARVGVPTGIAETLAPIIADVLAAVYADKAGDRIAERVMNAFSDAGNLYRILDPASLSRSAHRCGPELARIIGYGPGAVALLQPETVPAQIDWLNLSHSPWPDPLSGISRNESVPDLANFAVIEVCRALEVGFETLRGTASPERLASTVGNACLSVCGADGLPAPIGHTAPLDLVPFLLEQTRLREEWARG